MADARKSKRSRRDSDSARQARPAPAGKSGPAAGRPAAPEPEPEPKPKAKDEPAPPPASTDSPPGGAPPALRREVRSSGVPACAAPLRSAAQAGNEGTPGAPPAAGGVDVSFSPDIVVQIAEREVTAIEGVVELTGGWRTRGVQVEEPGGAGAEGYSIDVRIAVEYGVSCVALAGTIRSRVSAAIEHMTGRKVRAVNVRVTAVKDRGRREGEHEGTPHLGEEHGIDF